MSQIEELQRRITAAMERIGTGVEALSAPSPATGGDNPTLEAALEDERLANAQLEERLRSLKERYEKEIDALRAKSADAEEVAILKAEIEELRALDGDDPEKTELKEQLSEALTNLSAVEAARAELADAKAALESQDESDQLKAELEALRAENTRLSSELADSERTAELSAELEMLRAERASHGTAMSRLDDDLQRLRKANDQLQASVEELRSAAEAGLSDAELLNRATQAELEATQARRSSDAAEAHAVLARLEPLLANAGLAEGEVE